MRCWAGGWRSAMEMSVALLVTIILMTRAAWGHGAPISSGCLIRGDKADCSRLGLHYMPKDLSVTIASLDMSCNQISSIQREHLSALLRLKTLNVAFNQISSIDPLAFSNNSALQDVDLSNNRLPGAWDDSFAVLKFVRSLDVRNNSYISFNIPGSFTSLKALHHLKVGGLNVTEIHQNVSETMELEHLSIVTGDLTIYTPGSLSAFRSLQSVTLALTLRTNIALLTDIICDVSCNSVELQVQFVDFRGYRQNVDIFKCISNPGTIEVFNISHSQLTDNTITGMLNNIMKSQRIISFNLQQIGFDGIGDWQVPLLPIPVISLQSFLVDGIANPNFFGFSTMKNLHFFLFYLKYLTIRNSNLFYMPCQITFLCQNLHFLDLSNNLLTENTAFPQCEYIQLNNLNTLRLHKNYMSSLSAVGAMVKNLTALTLLDISANQIYSDQKSGCIWPINLQVLNASSNFLTDETFDCLPTSLYSIDVSNNRIQKVSERLLEFKHLHELYLSKNKLNFFPVELAHGIPSLKVLTLANNTLLGMKLTDLDTLGNLTLLDMRGNPFYCTCNILHFVTFCDNSSPLRIEGWPADYQCSNPEKEVGKQLSSVSFPILYCDTTLKIVIACVTTFVCTALLVGLCWYLDALWYLRMTWIWLQAKRRSFLSDPDGNAAYDAFVSYSQHDAVWVMEKLMPELESHSVPPFRLCVHERDFVPGRFIMDNIIDCIEQSRKTLFVISRSFVESEWCHYELYFAQQRLMESRDDALVLVLLEPIPRDSVPSRFCRLRRLIGRKTYLEWPAEQGKQVLFWANMRATLGKVKN
ncbi:toll-like receptor 2 isoform X2 [Lampetra planeri]